MTMLYNDFILVNLLFFFNTEGRPKTLNMLKFT